MKLPWKAIAAWYRAHGRDLPWRRTDDPYRIAVSEFMLQQTQVDRVAPLFKKFVAAFPSWKKLAEAPQADVVRAWKGLGYNMRAVRLRNMAGEIVARHDGLLPENAEALLALKGIGPYTARAIRAFAFRKRALAPDTNLRRVLYRFFKGPAADPKTFDERSWLLWEQTLPEHLSYEVNQGLMDIGATICKAGRPFCMECPLKTLCRSYPRILKVKTLPKQKPARKERVDADGIPNRIYRGRVIETLRKGPAAEKDLAGLLHVLPGLEKDGLIKRKNGRWVLA
ncbi:MAG: A/G-specific adenine glycosylase [Patescibacteria group bacterium]|nr:MAG: A/G-specific adenine glycosylase [Patescibacteria group bacterium]